MRLLVAVFVVAASLVVHAGEDKKSALARDLVKLSLSEEQWNKTMQMVTAQATVEQRQSIEKLIPYKDVVEFQVGLIAKHYEANEIQQLIAFYKTPLGQKSIHVAPQVASETQGFVMKRLQSELPKMMEQSRSKSSAAAATDANGAADRVPGK